MDDDVDVEAMEERAALSEDDDVLEKEDEDLAAEGARILAEIEKSRGAAAAG